MTALPKAEVAGEGMSREEWLKVRDTGLGGSDIAAVMRVETAWGSPYTVWLDKTGQGEETTETGPMKAGNKLEQAIAEWFGEESGIETIQPSPITIYRSLELPIALASPDRLALDSAGCVMGWVEIKNVGAHRADEWTGEVPAHYEAQCQWQLAVSGLPVCYLAVLIGGQDLRWCEIEARPAEQARMFEEAERFWKYVEAMTEPELDGSERTKKAIGDRYGSPTPDAIEGGTSLALAVAEFLDAQAEEKATKERMTKAESAIKLILREHEGGTVQGQIVCTWKPQGRRLDLDAVRAHLGADASRFEQTTEFRVLRIPKAAR